jgi:hypothetical protein
MILKSECRLLRDTSSPWTRHRDPPSLKCMRSSLRTSQRNVILEWLIRKLLTIMNLLNNEIIYSFANVYYNFIIVVTIRNFQNIGNSRTLVRSTNRTCTTFRRISMYLWLITRSSVLSLKIIVYFPVCSRSYLKRKLEAWLFGTNKNS